MNTADYMIHGKSVHIFAWPFTYREKSADFFGRIEKKGWARKKEDPDNRDDFMLHQYLSAQARDIFIFQKRRKGEDICRVYEYPINEGAEFSYYILVKEDESYKTYTLPIVSVSLHLYRHKVGILLIQAANLEYPEIEDIKRINDYGRRTALPFLPRTEDGFILCAEQLGILGDGITVSEPGADQKIKNVVNFRELAGNGKNAQKVTAQFLHDLLNCNLDHHGVSDIRVTPTTDERMFLICLIRDDLLSDQIKRKEYNHSREAQNLMYTLLYVDPDTSTCQEETMCRELLEQAIYRRWLDYGTLYGVTNYSLVCITGSTTDIDDSVVRPFLVEYTMMASLVIAQEITICNFSEEAGKKVDYNVGWRKIFRLISLNLTNLQRDYIIFRNQMMIPEFSRQEQGMELYHMMQERLLVKREQEVLNEQLQSLYEMVNVENSNWIGIVGVILALLAIILDIIVNLKILI